MNIYFYDNFSNSYNRFGNNITNRLLKNYTDVKVFYIHDNYDKGVVNIDENHPDRHTVIPASQVKEFVKKYKPASFLSFSYRIPDVYWTLFFNNLGVPTFQVQHGLYVDNYKRSASFVFKEIRRVFSYLCYLLKIAVQVRNRKDTLGSLINKDIRVSIDSLKIDSSIKSKNLIIWGEWWKEWFKETLGYNEQTKYHICGSFDFALLKEPEKLDRSDKDSITYVCQTLVEDGRLNPRYFSEFISVFESVVAKTEKRVFIKYHPRSDKSLYSGLEKYRNVTFTTLYPFSQLYIGHYSSLLTISSYMKKRIVLVEFPGHPTPKQFLHMTDEVIPHYQKIDINKTSNYSIDTEYYYKFLADPYLMISKTLGKNLCCSVSEISMDEICSKC